MRGALPCNAGGMRRLLRDCRGTSAIEFALVGPFVVFLALGTIELATDMIIDASVQIAAQSASRAGLTVEPPADGLPRADEASATVHRILSGWVNVGATVNVTEADFGSLNNLGAANPTAGPGDFGDVIAYNITLTIPGITGIPNLFGVPMLTFQRNYLVQNEK
jgi:Flp pilus assembly protein TadG